MKKIILILLIVFLVTILFLVFHSFITKSCNPIDYSAYYSDGGYGEIPSFPPSVWLTFSAINAMDDIDKEKIKDINSFLDRNYLTCNSTCSNYFLFEFVMSKKKLGVDESEIRENYEIHKILLDRYGKKIYITNPFFLLAVNQFTNPPLLNNSEKKIFLDFMINESQQSLSIQSKVNIIMAVRSCNFSNSELDEMRATYSQKYTSFCSIQKLEELKDSNGDIDACDELNYLIVRNFCGQELTEDEKSIVIDSLSNDYKFLEHKICKQQIYKLINICEDD